jgi:hypothetical protein
MFKNHMLALAAVLTVAGAGLTATPLASAKDGDGVRARGTCTHGSSATLKVHREDNGIEVEFEVDQNRNHVPWKVMLRRNGSLVLSSTATTRAPSGSFEIHRVTSGSGTISAVATRSGERCAATVAS